MVKCCVAPGCSNRQGRDFVSFYRFPCNNHGNNREQGTDREKRCNRRARWIAAVRRVMPAGASSPERGWEPTPYDRLCSRHFISGKKSEDPMSPDYVPSVFSHQTSQDKKRGELALERYNRWKESKRGREVIKKRQEVAKSQPQPSVTKVNIEDASASVSGEDIPSDSDTLSIMSGMLDYEAVSREALMEEHQEPREYSVVLHVQAVSPSKVESQSDQQNAEEPHKSTRSSFSCPPINNLDTAPAAAFNSEEKLDDDKYYLTEGSDDSDEDDGVKYEDPTALLLTGKTKELMRLLQVYRNNTIDSAVPERHQEPSGSREQKTNSDATSRMEQTVGQHVTSYEKRLREPPPKGQQTFKIDNVTYMNVMTYTEEEALAKYITKSAKINTRLTMEEICHLVYNFCLAVSITLPPPWMVNRSAAMEWVKGFMRRHQIFLTSGGKNCRDSCGENSGIDDSSAVRKNTASKQARRLYGYDDGNVRSRESISETINLDHAYALKPGTKVIFVKCLKGNGTYSESIKT